MPLRETAILKLAWSTICFIRDFVTVPKETLHLKTGSHRDCNPFKVGAVGIACQPGEAWMSAVLSNPTSEALFKLLRATAVHLCL